MNVSDHGGAGSVDNNKLSSNIFYHMQPENNSEILFFVVNSRSYDKGDIPGQEVLSCITGRRYSFNSTN